MKKKELFGPVLIEDFSHDGRGVGRIDGFVVFVANTIPQEIVKACWRKKSKKYGEGELLTVVKPSPFRIKPRCDVFNSCGGCQLQHLNYNKQLEFKSNKVLQALKRLGQQTITKVPIYATKEIFRYRNKGSYKLGWQNDQYQLGFFAQNSHQIVPHQSCLLQTLTADKGKTSLEKLWNKGVLQGGKGVTIRSSFYNQEQMIILEGSIDIKKGIRYLIESLSDEWSTLVSVFQQQSPKHKPQLLWGKKFLAEQLGALIFELSPLSFFQVNSYAHHLLLECVAKLAALKQNDILFDLYCGVGAFALNFASKVNKVFGLEINQQAVENATQKAKKLDLQNVFIEQGAAEKKADLFKRSQANVLLLDPPRQGCSENVIAAINQSLISKIIYVSCDPATLARDINSFSAGGFSIRDVVAVDMFPQTHHVETVVLMSRVDK